MSDTNDEESGEQKSVPKLAYLKKWKIKPTKAQIIMIAAGTFIVIAVSVVLYNMPEKKEPGAHGDSQHKSADTAHQETYKKELHKIMTAARQNAVKPPVAGPDNHFGNSTTAKAGDMSKPPLLGGKQEMNSDALPAAVAAQKRRTLSPYLLHKLNARHVVKAKRLPESITSSMAIPQKPADFVVAPTLTDPREIARKQTADNIKLFMSKGWTSYYSHNNEVLLYRAPDEGGTDTRKMVNTAWFVGDSSIVLFANALNCPDKSIDTFAYMELDGKTLKTTTSGVRDSAEKGTQLKDIQEASDLALHGKVCGN